MVRDVPYSPYLNSATVICPFRACFGLVVISECTQIKSFSPEASFVWGLFVFLVLFSRLLTAVLFRDAHFFQHEYEDMFLALIPKRLTYLARVHQGHGGTRYLAPFMFSLCRRRHDIRTACLIGPYGEIANRRNRNRTRLFCAVFRSDVCW